MEKKKPEYTVNHKENQNYIKGLKTYLNTLILGDKGRWYEEGK